MVDLAGAQQIFFDQVSDAIVILDARQPGLPILAANQVCRDLWGLDGEALTGKPWDRVFTHATAHGIPALLHRSMKTGESFVVERVPCLLGSRVRPPWRAQQLTYWDWKCSALRGPDRQIAELVLIMADVTGQQAIEQADQERDAFLSLISHEIKSPLTSIKGFAQLAARVAATGEGPAGRTAKYLRAIDQQTERIGRLVGNLSDVARLRGGRLLLQPVAFNLVPFIRTLAAQPPIDQQRHQIEVALPRDPLIVHADPARIAQALANLLTNAAKYSPDAERIAVTLDRQDTAAHLAVRDWGIGIPRDEQPLIYGRFYRAANGAAHGLGGLGLGLFIANQIITRSGGEIVVESEEGRGSTFHVTLPLCEAGSDTAQLAEQPVIPALLSEATLPESQPTQG
jgi:signal transduction histidine kinase